MGAAAKKNVLVVVDMQNDYASDARPPAGEHVTLVEEGYCGEFVPLGETITRVGEQLSKGGVLLDLVVFTQDWLPDGVWKNKCGYSSLVENTWGAEVVDSAQAVSAGTKRIAFAKRLDDWMNDQPGCHDLTWASEGRSGPQTLEQRLREELKVRNV